MQTGESHLPLALDAMGGDLGPSEVVAGLVLALRDKRTQGDVMLVGDQAILKPLVAKAGLAGNPRVGILHASDVIHMHDKPIQALRQKKDSSMLRAIEAVRDRQACAAVSLGNTGALMAAGTLRLRPMEGIERPAIATILPTRGAKWVLIDGGANPDPDPLHLVHNAILGSVYAKAVLSIARPRVGLLSIGTEEGKGTMKTTLTDQMLRKTNGIIEYLGLVEGFQMFNQTADVIVCDGFTGNILLKSLESCFSMLKNSMKKELMANPLRILGALMCTGAFKALKRELSPADLGGAPLLGLNGLVFKAHGSSPRDYVAGAVRIALETAHRNINGLIAADVSAARERLEQNEDADDELDRLPSP